MEATIKVLAALWPVVQMAYFVFGLAVTALLMGLIAARRLLSPGVAEEESVLRRRSACDSGDPPRKVLPAKRGSARIYYDGEYIGVESVLWGRWSTVARCRLEEVSEVLPYSPARDDPWEPSELFRRSPKDGSWYYAFVGMEGSRLFTTSVNQWNLEALRAFLISLGVGFQGLSTRTSSEGAFAGGAEDHARAAPGEALYCHRCGARANLNDGACPRCGSTALDTGRSSPNAPRATLEAMRARVRAEMNKKSVMTNRRDVPAGTDQA